MERIKWSRSTVYVFAIGTLNFDYKFGTAHLRERIGIVGSDRSVEYVL